MEILLYTCRISGREQLRKINSSTIGPPAGIEPRLCDAGALL